MFGKKKTATDQAFDRYTDPTGQLPNRELEVSGWFLRHRLLLEHLGVGVLLVFCVVTMGYSVISWGFYLASGYFADQDNLSALRNSFENYTLLQPNYRAQELEIKETSILPSAPGKYDFLTMIRNPNDRHTAEVTFHFIVDGQDLPTYTDTLLPGEERPVGSFGVALDQSPNMGQMVIDSVKWQRINPHQVPDVAAFINTRRDIIAEHVTFTSELEDGGILTFDLVNRSAYSYWQPILYVMLLNGGDPSGAVFVSVDKLRAFETRALTVRVLAPNIPVTDIVVYPVLNVFSLDAYMMPGTP